jgi:DNA-binding protein HU-beta
MTKADLVASIAAKSNMTKAAAERSLTALLDAVQAELRSGGKLTISGFGTFAVEQRKARKGRNPRTGQVITIKASKVVKFRSSKALKEAVK